jgi:3-carboxy-cis,cis-muconate cycloisomerase
MFTTPEMEAIFAPDAHIRHMLAFEAALARAEAAAGVIPVAAAELIAAACHEDFDSSAMYAEAAVAGTLAIPLVRLLRTRVAGDAADYVHWGATSQDAIDSAAMLQMRAGLNLLLADLLVIGARCSELAQEHRRTLQSGRTLLQHALPITFGDSMHLPINTVPPLVPKQCILGVRGRRKMPFYSRIAPKSDEEHALPSLRYAVVRGV